LKRAKHRNKIILLIIALVVVVSGFLLLQNYLKSDSALGTGSGKEAYANSLAEFSKSSNPEDNSFLNSAVEINSDSASSSSASENLNSALENTQTDQANSINADQSDGAQAGSSAGRTSQQQATLEDIMATRHVLQLEAERQNIVVSDELVDSTIQSSLQMYDMTEEELQSQLSKDGMSMESYKAEMKTNLEIAKLITDNVDLDSVTVSAEEVDAYIASNQESFSDFLGSPDAMEMIKIRVRSLLFQQKQNDVISDYVETIAN